jgi:hypothetical protein
MTKYEVTITLFIDASSGRDAEQAVKEMLDKVPIEKWYFENTKYENSKVELNK